MRLTVLMTAAFLILAPAANAQLAARSADEWLATLENPARLQGLKIHETVAALKIRPGDVVADVGTGSGAFVGALSSAAGPGGKVYAEDVEAGLVEALRKRAAQAGLSNVAPVLGGFTDPKLPARDVDIALIYDVLHHVEDRETFLRALSGYIKPGGRVALVDFIPEVGGHKGQPALQISKAQATAWMASAGLEPAEDIALFQDKYFVIYRKR